MDELQRDFELHLEAGLIHYETRDEEDIFLGTDAQWRKYFELAGWELSLKEPE